MINEDREAQLAARLLQFEETLDVVAREGTPHVMCSYLYDLAGLFSGFYEHCPILSAESEAVRNSRLKLAQLTAKTLKLGLDTLGYRNRREPQECNKTKPGKLPLSLSDLNLFYVQLKIEGVCANRRYSVSKDTGLPWPVRTAST
jgi:hypothetical protein